MCVCERGREGASESACAGERERERARESIHARMCVREREKERDLAVDVAVALLNFLHSGVGFRVQC